MLSDVQLKAITQNVLRELQNAHEHNNSSIPFIVNQLPSKPPVEPGKTFQVLSVGGTNYKSALFALGHDGKLIMSNRETGECPFFETKDQLVEFVSGVLDPHVEYLAINFAYPIQPIFRNGLLDGVLLSGSKHGTFTGLVGNVIGELLETALGNVVNISVANDTICLLLAGKTLYRSSELGAAIIGTGYNAAFFLDDVQAVNLEAAAFDAFETSPECKTIDESSRSKGEHLFEKEVSGAYLYQHFNLKEKVSAQIASTEEMDKVAQDEHHLDHIVARQLFEYSAQLVATHMAGILEFQQRDVHFVVEGSLFWRGWRDKETVEEWVTQLCSQYKADFFQVEDSELWGAAQLLV